MVVAYPMTIPGGSARIVDRKFTRNVRIRTTDSPRLSLDLSPDNHWLHNKNFPMCAYPMVSKYTKPSPDESPTAEKLSPMKASIV